MRIGKLRHRIELQTLQSGGTGPGGLPLPSAWVTVSKAWAQMLPLAGREYYTAAAVSQEHNIKWRIRYRKDITAEMRVYEPLSGRSYDIHDVQNVDGLNKEMLLISEEVRDAS